MLTGHSEPAAPSSNKDIPLCGVSGGYIYTEMMQFYSSQTKSYQGSISGEPEITHSFTVTLITTTSVTTNGA